MNKDTQDFSIKRQDLVAGLQKYTIQVRGCDVIDYEKIKIDDPALFQKLLDQELESDRLADDALEKLLKMNIPKG